MKAEAGRSSCRAVCRAELDRQHAAFVARRAAMPEEVVPRASPSSPGRNRDHPRYGLAGARRRVHHPAGRPRLLVPQGCCKVAFQACMCRPRGIPKRSNGTVCGARASRRRASAIELPALRADGPGRADRQGPHPIVPRHHLVPRVQEGGSVVAATAVVVAVSAPGGVVDEAAVVVAQGALSE